MFSSTAARVHSSFVYASPLLHHKAYVGAAFAILRQLGLFVKTRIIVRAHDGKCEGLRQASCPLREDTPSAAGSHN